MNGDAWPELDERPPSPGAVSHWTMDLRHGGVRLPGWRRHGDDVLVGPADRTMVLLRPPVNRRWSPHGVLEAESRAAWSWRDGPGGVIVEADRNAQLDLLEMDATAAAQLRSDRSRPLTVMGSFEPLGPPRELARFFAGGSVLDTNAFGGRRCPSEQTALSIYRLARARGGPFWDGIADWLADWVARRLTPGALPVHDLWGAGECHTRFLLDGVLVLLAQSEWRGEGAWSHRAEAGLAAVDRLRTPLGGGSWVRHDSTEVDGDRNDWVLNTHLQAIVVLIAAGRDVTPEVRSLAHVLRARPRRRAQAWKVASAVLVADVTQAWMPGADGPGRSLSLRGREGISRLQQAGPFLRLPTGWLERDVTASASPSHYHSVNVADLASLSAAMDHREVARALKAGVRYSKMGRARAERRLGDATAVLWPIVLGHLGRARAARRAARAAEGAGFAPAIGWPGHRDDLWSLLPGGVP